jgi:hypothetical protein
VVEINQSAQVVEGFHAIVETISACMPEDFMMPNAQQALARIRRRLNIGSALSLAANLSASQLSSPPIFQLSQDSPGNFSSQGVRHDNDHAEIANIQILPTAQEITSLRTEYLPLIDSSNHHLPGLAGLLDRQFRLLREDTVGQLRDAAREEIEKLQQLDRNAPTHNVRQGIRKLVYRDFRFSRLCIDRIRGLQVVAEFDQPP